MNIDYELVGFSEIDKYAIASYCAIHGVNEDLNLGDISKIDIEDVPDCDLITDLYYYKDLKLFPKEEDKVRIGMAAFIVGWHKQYLNWLVEKAKCNSGSYVFVEYITKEEIINRNEILK